MIVRLRFLRQAEEFRKLLEQDGWELKRTEDGLLIAEHAEVSSERNARIRLNCLGLLTSSALRMEFMIWGGSIRKQDMGNDLIAVYLT